MEKWDSLEAFGERRQTAEGGGIERNCRDKREGERVWGRQMRVRQMDKMCMSRMKMLKIVR